MSKQINVKLLEIKKQYDNDMFILKNKYDKEISELKKELKKFETIEFEEEKKKYEIINLEVYDDFWQKYLKVYETIYKNENKIYYTKDQKFHEILILNSIDINDMKFIGLHKNEYNKIVYKFSNNNNIYIWDKEWIKYEIVAPDNPIYADFLKTEPIYKNKDKFYYIEDQKFQEIIFIYNFNNYTK